MTDRFDQLAPRDVAITLRSMRRRFGDVDEALSDPELGPLADRPGPAGSSLGQILADLARSAALLANGLERALDHEQPMLEPELLAPADRSYVDDRPLGAEASLAGFIDDAERAATRVEGASSGALARDVGLVGGATTTPLAVARQLAREVVAGLEAADRQLDWLRSSL